MDKISIVPVINTDHQINSKIEQVFKNGISYFTPLFFIDNNEYLEHIIYETPDLLIMNFANDTKTFDLLENMSKDMWLNCSGIIGIYSGKENDFLDKIKTANLIAAIPNDEIERKLPKVLEIINENRNILFMRDLQNTFTGETSGSFIIENDLLEIEVFINLIANYVYNLNYINASKKIQLKLILQELLINAIEHGNCGISFDEKTRLTFKEGLFGEEIIKKKIKEDPSIKNKIVKFDYLVKKDCIKATIKDEGEGFDWQKVLNKGQDESDEGQFLLHGRGIMLVKENANELKYNIKGNQVSFIFSYDNKAGFKVPALFEEYAATNVTAGTVVFKEDDASDYLYYIASGKYRVTKRNIGELAILTPNDLFMGEMSFLLNNKRTATVIAIEDGILYKISKKNFIAAIKRYPYYSFLLCKILARRLKGDEYGSSIKKSIT